MKTRTPAKTRTSAIVGMVVIGLLAAALPVAHLAAGEKAASSPDKKVQMLFVQSAKGASLEGDRLTLDGVSPTTVYFSDRPSRIAGHLATEEMVPLWGEGKNSFTKDPPNATLSAFTKDGKVANVVVELRNPVLAGDRMSYDVRVLQGKLPAGAGTTPGVSLFIDVVGMPLTPVSYAGAARRAARRTVVVR